MNRFFNKIEQNKKIQILASRVKRTPLKEQTLLEQVAPLDWIPKTYQHYLKDICEKEVQTLFDKKTLH